jgi:hypothetical protein
MIQQQTQQQQQQQQQQGSNMTPTNTSSSFYVDVQGGASSYVTPKVASIDLTESGHQATIESVYFGSKIIVGGGVLGELMKKDPKSPTSTATTTTTSTNLKRKQTDEEDEEEENDETSDDEDETKVGAIEASNSLYASSYNSSPVNHLGPMQGHYPWMKGGNHLTTANLYQQQQHHHNNNLAVNVAKMEATSPQKANNTSSSLSSPFYPKSEPSNTTVLSSSSCGSASSTSPTSVSSASNQNDSSLSLPITAATVTGNLTNGKNSKGLYLKSSRCSYFVDHQYFINFPKKSVYFVLIKLVYKTI